MRSTVKEVMPEYDGKAAAVYLDTDNDDHLKLMRILQNSQITTNQYWTAEGELLATETGVKDAVHVREMLDKISSKE